MDLLTQTDRGVFCCVDIENKEQALGMRAPWALLGLHQLGMYHATRFFMDIPAKSPRMIKTFHATFGICAGNPFSCFYCRTPFQSVVLAPAASPMAYTPASGTLYFLFLLAQSPGWGLSMLLHSYLTATIASTIHTWVEASRRRPIFHSQIWEKTTFGLKVQRYISIQGDFQSLDAFQLPQVLLLTGVS